MFAFPFFTHANSTERNSLTFYAKPRLRSYKHKTELDVAVLKEKHRTAQDEVNARFHLSAVASSFRWSEMKESSVNCLDELCDAKLERSVSVSDKESWLPPSCVKCATSDVASPKFWETPNILTSSEQQCLVWVGIAFLPPPAYPYVCDACKATQYQGRWLSCCVTRSDANGGQRLTIRQCEV